MTKVTKRDGERETDRETERQRHRERERERERSAACVPLKSYSRLWQVR